MNRPEQTGKPQSVEDQEYQNKAFLPQIQTQSSTVSRGNKRLANQTTHEDVSHNAYIQRRDNSLDQDQRTNQQTEVYVNQPEDSRLKFSRSFENIGFAKMISTGNKENKVADLETQVILNRINLLKIQEYQNWKKIQDTKFQVENILNAKNRHRYQIEQKRRYEEENKNLEERLRDINQMNRERSLKQQNDTRKSIQRNRNKEFLKLQEERLMNEQQTRMEQEELKEKQKQRAEMIRFSNYFGTMKILEFQQDYIQKNLGYFNQEFQQQEEIQKSKLRDLEQLQKIELDMINKIQTTHQIHKNVINELEDVITKDVQDFKNLYRNNNQKPEYGMLQQDFMKQKKASSISASNPNLHSTSTKSFQS